MYQQGDRAYDSSAVLKYPTDTADVPKNGASEACQKERKSSLGTDQNIISSLHLASSAFSMASPGQVQNPAYLTFSLCTVFNPVPQSGFDPDFNRN